MIGLVFYLIIVTFVALIIYGAILAFAFTRKKNHWWAHVIVVGSCVVFLLWGQYLIFVLADFSVILLKLCMK